MNDSPAVKLWRDFARLNLSASWKADVDKTITDLSLWRDILDHWYYVKNGKKIRKSPAIKVLLDEYERRQFDAIQQKGSGVYREEGIPERSTGRMPERELPTLWAGKRL